jgi:hypothetical protein
LESRVEDEWVKEVLVVSENLLYEKHLSVELAEQAVLVVVANSTDGEETQPLAETNPVVQAEQEVRVVAVNWTDGEETLPLAEISPVVQAVRVVLVNSIYEKHLSVEQTILVEQAGRIFVAN